MARRTSKRATVGEKVATDVLVASNRRCCLCYFVDRTKRPRRGQIAHLDHDASNSDFSNLVFLCLDHHDEFDSRPSQSKGFTTGEVKEYRDRLYQKLGTIDTALRAPAVDDDQAHLSNALAEELKRVVKRAEGEMDFLYRPWHLGWQTEGKPELFAYKSPNGCDGICRLERIDLPDERVVMICEQIDGNPGMSVTNAIEYIAFQLCEQFDVNPEKLVLIEHYDTWFNKRDEWDLVSFAKKPPESNFDDPEWTPMTEEDWRSLGFRPRQRRVKQRRYLPSLVRWYKPQTR